MIYRLIFIILIFLVSSTVCTQTKDIKNMNGVRNKNDVETNSSNKSLKSKSLLSISSGYSGIAKISDRKGGFNIQVDYILPVTTYFALNTSLNYARFSGYQKQSGHVLYDEGALTHFTLSPGFSFGNFIKDNKFNYFITAGFAIGMGGTGQSIYTDINTGEILNRRSGSLVEIMGLQTSGRISYKLTQSVQIFIEPLIYILWSDDGLSNYHINGGEGIVL